MTFIRTFLDALARRRPAPAPVTQDDPRLPLARWADPPRSYFDDRWPKEREE